MFPNTHAQPVSYVTVKFSTESFHTTYLEVVNPPSDKLIKFLNLIAVAYSPATTSEFFHPFLELRYRLCMWFCPILMRNSFIVKAESKVFESLWLIYFAFGYIYLKP